mmetsp:Transcript_37020/g.76944  ORF Transcript_37020/g.76944 Transcript_37020/m.76944 type:complete len:91 (-) Transcript_37020:193-465(-)
MHACSLHFTAKHFGRCSLELIGLGETKNEESLTSTSSFSLTRTLSFLLSFLRVRSSPSQTATTAPMDFSLQKKKYTKFDQNKTKKSAKQA